MPTSNIPFQDPTALTTFRALMGKHESLFGWLSHEDGMEHYDAQIQRKGAYRYLMHTHSGSLVVLYNPEGAATWDAARVVAVWEGQASVVASDLGEWLRTLHDGYVLSEVFTAAMMHGLVPSAYPEPPKAITPEKLDGYRTAARAGEPAFDAMVAELDAAGFHRRSDVVERIWAAKQAEPALVL